MLKIFGEAMTEAEVEKIEASDKDRAKNFSLEMLEKMFAEKILQVLQKSSFGRFSPIFFVLIEGERMSSTSIAAEDVFF